MAKASGEERGLGRASSNGNISRLIGEWIGKTQTGRGGSVGVGWRVPAGRHRCRARHQAQGSPPVALHPAHPVFVFEGAGFRV